MVDMVVSPREIEACHRLLVGINGKKTIVRFVDRKDVVAALTSRALLKGSNIFIEENFCPFISKLGYMCRKLKRKGSIFSTWMRNGAVFIKVRGRDKPQIIKHPYDLINDYPGFDFS